MVPEEVIQMANSKLPAALCDSCPLRDAECVPPFGPSDAEVILLGEAPGASDAIEGKPFAGQNGKLLDAILQNAGSSLEKMYRTNVVACRPPGNRTPTEREIACCSPRLDAELANHGASRIISLGRTAHERMGLDGTIITRGIWIKHESGKWLMPTWHPAYVLRKPSEAPELISDVTKALRPPLIPSFALKDPDVVVIETVDVLSETLDKVPDDTWVAFDIESNQVRWYDTAEAKANSMLMLQMAWCEEYGVVLSDQMLYDVPGVPEILTKFFARVKTVGHNGKFDQVFLRTVNIPIHLDFDTMLAHYTLKETPPHGLKELCAEEFSMPNYEDRLIKQYLRTRNDEYSKIPFDKLAQYGVLDAVATLKLREVFEESLREEGLYEWPFQNVVMRAANHFVDFEVRGIPVDLDYLKDAQGRFDEELGRITKLLREAAGDPGLNPNSTQQMAVVLYDKLKLPVPQTKSKAKRSTAHEALEQLEGMSPIVDILLRHRRIAKLKNSYIDNFIEAADLNGRIHPSVFLHGTETGRLSMRDPAAQTIPRSMNPNDPHYDKFLDGAVIKGAICAPEGYVLVVCDYSQAELRCLAHYSQDPFLLQVYRDNRDLHSEVTLAMFGPGYSKEQRVRCKMFNFSWVYGGNEYSFARDQGIPIAIARKFVQDYNKVMAGAVKWKADQFNDVLKRGYSQTIFGRRRRFPFVVQENYDDCRKASVNAPLQSTASDLTLLSALDAMDQGLPVVHLVHDSILALVREEEAEKVGVQLSDIMKGMGEKWMPSIPWKVDVEIGKRWTEPPNLS